MTDSSTNSKPAINLQLDTPAYKWWQGLGNPKTVVAPMVNQSELAFRLLCLRHGADLTYTPMLHSKLFVDYEEYRRDQFETCFGDTPLIAQFCCNDPAIMIEAVNMCLEKEKNDWVLNYRNGKRKYGFVGKSGRILRFDSAEDSEDEEFAAYCRNFTSNIKAVDLNCGCPQRCAKRGGYGAFLSQKQVENIVSTIHNSKKLSVPLAVKIRILPDVQHTLKYAEMIRDCGAQLLCVHGRTREQKGSNTGLADWNRIRMIRESITDIPIISNGNIRCAADFDDCIAHTGVDAVMSANGFLDNPALLETPEWISPEERVDIVDPENPHLFIPRREVLLAKEYLNIVGTIRPNTTHSVVRAHVFKMCAPELARNNDLRSLLSSYTMTFRSFSVVVDEIIHRSRYGLHTGDSLDQYFEDEKWGLDRDLVEDLPVNQRELEENLNGDIKSDGTHLVQFPDAQPREAERVSLEEICERECSKQPQQTTTEFFNYMAPAVKEVVQLHYFRDRKKRIRNEVRREKEDVLQNSSLDSLFNFVAGV